MTVVVEIMAKHCWVLLFIRTPCMFSGNLYSFPNISESHWCLFVIYIIVKSSTSIVYYYLFNYIRTLLYFLSVGYVICQSARCQVTVHSWLLTLILDNIHNDHITVIVASLPVCNSGRSQTKAGFVTCYTWVSGCCCCVTGFIVFFTCNKCKKTAIL